MTNKFFKHAFSAILVAIIASGATAQLIGGSLNPMLVDKFVTPMLIPPVMPKNDTIVVQGGKNIDYYEISVKQFLQQILPPGHPKTVVWGYGPETAAKNNAPMIHNAPSLTIEAKWTRPVRVKWINDLREKDENGDYVYLSHLLPVDQTLHWANPSGENGGIDTRPDFSDQATPDRYDGPVPIVTHVHGAVGVGDESDGYTEAWFLPDAPNIPAGYATNGTWYEFFKDKAFDKFGVTWEPGSATFQYPNEGRASCDWYHDHTLGMTRVNVYAGPAGFYIIRGGPDGDGAVLDQNNAPAVLPGPAPKPNDKYPPTKDYYEIPIVIQDRSFNTNGTLFYPDSRSFFPDGLGGFLGPYIPETDISPIWNPEFFGNMIMVNGNTWPYQIVEKRRYRFRFLNGCQSRFLILDFSAIAGVDVWVIGNEGGFINAPFNLVNANTPNTLLMAPAERFDVIVDFTQVAEGNYILKNIGPDSPYKGPHFPPPARQAFPDTTGQIMQFRVVPIKGADTSTPPEFLMLPPITALGGNAVPPNRPLALLEKVSSVNADEPAETLLGIVNGDPNTGAGTWTEQHWATNPTGGDPNDPNNYITPGSIETWELYNGSEDAHPIHIHEVAFQVENRQAIFVDRDFKTFQVQPGSMPVDPEPWETGFKDTVIVYPGQVTRVKIQFASEAGRFVWHCHLLEHEDNEMMLPLQVGDPEDGAPRDEM